MKKFFLMLMAFVISSCSSSNIEYIYETEEVLVYEQPKRFAPIQRRVGSLRHDASYAELKILDKIKEVATVKYHGAEFSQSNLVANTIYKAKLKLNENCDFIEDGDVVDNIEDEIDWNLSYIRKVFKPLKKVRRSKIRKLRYLAHDLAEAMEDEHGCYESNRQIVMALQNSVESDNQALKMLGMQN